MAEYRIDDLAAVSGVTVRNIRFYQEKGLLQPPRKVGRVGIYSDAHLGRLRLIGQMIERGYTFAAIGDLLAAWEQGRDVSEILGLEDALNQPWRDEPPRHATLADLVALLGSNLDEAQVAQLVEQGVALRLLRPDGDGFEVASPALVDAAAELVALGVPLDRVLGSAQVLIANLRLIGTELVSLIVEQVGDRQPSPAEVADLVQRFRPHAKRAMDALFALTMEDLMAQSADALTRKYKQPRA